MDVPATFDRPLGGTHDPGAPGEWVVVVLLKPSGRGRAGPPMADLQTAVAAAGPLEVLARSQFGYLLRGRFRATSSTHARGQFMQIYERVVFPEPFEIVGTSARPADDLGRR